ncbi:hypothetical protein D9M70_523390 [compost metagenome]
MPPHIDKIAVNSCRERDIHLISCHKIVSSNVKCERSLTKWSAFPIRFFKLRLPFSEEIKAKDRLYPALRLWFVGHGEQNRLQPNTGAKCCIKVIGIDFLEARGVGRIFNRCENGIRVPRKLTHAAARFQTVETAPELLTSFVF